MVIKMTKRSEVNNVKVIKIKKEYIWIIIKKYAEVKLSESAPLYQYSPILINTGVPYMIFFFTSGIFSIGLLIGCLLNVLCLPLISFIYSKH